MKRNMTKAQAVAEWRKHVKPGIVRRYGSDKPALRESWNNFTDMLCRDGRISMKQYESWDSPSDCK